MVLRVLSWLSILVLIAAFSLTFKFSIASIEEYFMKNEAEKLINIKAKRFLKRLTFEDKDALGILPCYSKLDNKKCSRASKIKQILNDERNEAGLEYLDFFNEKGKNLFTGKKLAKQYSNLINDDRNLFIDKGVENQVNGYKIIYVKRLYEFENDNKFNNIYLISIISSDKLSASHTLFCVIIVSLFILPLIYLEFYVKRILKANIEEKERAEEDLEEVFEKMETLKSENIQQSNFLANFTHELRTPLNSVIGFSGLIKDQTLGEINNPEYVKYANDINNAGIHLLSLINDILDYTKAEVGRLKVSPTEIDIVKVIKQCMAIVAPRASESGVELLQSITSNHVILKLDQKRVKQIILNLLSNSVKFTPENGSVTISVFPDIKGERIYIEVKDTGVGIEEKDISKVMSLFGQVDSEFNRKYEGTGIGLPFSKKLTNMMGGTFELSSKVNMGTRVTLGFPFDKKINAEFLEMMGGNN